MFERLLFVSYFENEMRKGKFFDSQTKQEFYERRKSLLKVTYISNLSIINCYCLVVKGSRRLFAVMNGAGVCFAYANWKYHLFDDITELIAQQK